MRIGVIGAGIAGLTTAFELAEAGHEVTVHDRRDAVAEESSFAHAGLLSASLLSPAAGPGPRRLRLGGQRPGEAALRWRPGMDAAQYRWILDWWRGNRTRQADAERAVTGLAVHSLQRLDELTRTLHLDYERSQGVLVLMQDDKDRAPLQRHLALLRELDWPANELSARDCLDIEPHLGSEPPDGALHLPGDGVGNCRQMAQQLRDKAEQLHGVEFQFGSEVAGLRRNGRTISLQLRPRARDTRSDAAGAPRKDASADDTGFAPTQPFFRDESAAYDAVVVCSGADAALLNRFGLSLPLQPVWGHTATFRLHPDGLALRSAVVDAATGVTLTRLGQRLRVTGGFELGAGPKASKAAQDEALAPLYAALDRWFPHAVDRKGVQIWQGARPTLPQGPPVIGPSALPGVWLNLGHGAHGWTLACGSARLLADLIGGRDTSVDPAPFAASRGSGPQR